MRRKDREVKDFEIIKQIIDECNVIRIGLMDDDMYPYIVPMNFAYKVDGENICFYIHGALAGRRYELMKKNGVCSFEMDCAHRMKFIYETMDVTMAYKSVMGKANIEFLEDEKKKEALDLLMNRDKRTENFDYNKSIIPYTAVVKLTVTECTGKINPF